MVQALHPHGHLISPSYSAMQGIPGKSLIISQVDQPVKPICFAEGRFFSGREIDLFHD